MRNQGKSMHSLNARMRHFSPPMLEVTSGSVWWHLLHKKHIPRVNWRYPLTKTKMVLRVALRKGARTVLQRESLHTSTRQETPPPATVTVQSATTDAQKMTNTMEHHQVKHMDSLPGPPGWPIIGNFATYLRKKNHGKIHHVQVSSFSIII